MKAEDLKIGCKVDIRLEKTKEGDRVFASKVYDRLEGGGLEIGMPMDGGKLVLLELNARYKMLFFTDDGMFECVCQVTRRYKKGELYMVSVDVKTPLKKTQRRSFFRLVYAMRVRFKYGENKWMLGETIDISGAGMRFITSENMEEVESLTVRFTLNNSKINNEYEISGSVVEVEKRDGKYIVRLRFNLQPGRVQDQITMFIFDAQRTKAK